MRSSLLLISSTTFLALTVPLSDALARDHGGGGPGPQPARAARLAVAPARMPASQRMPMPVARPMPMQRPMPVARQMPMQRPMPVARQMPMQRPMPVARQMPMQRPMRAARQAPDLRARHVSRPQQMSRPVRIAQPARQTQQMRENQPMRIKQPTIMQSFSQSRSALNGANRGRRGAQSTVHQQHLDRQGPIAKQQTSPKQKQHGLYPINPALKHPALLRRPVERNVPLLHSERPQAGLITGRSPANVQKEQHREALSQLRDDHSRRLINPGHAAAAGAIGGAVVGGMAYQQMRGHNENNQQINNNRSDDNRMHGSNANVNPNGHRANNVPQLPDYANPRHMPGEGRGQPVVSKAPAPRLAYRPGINLYPRQGDRQKGIPGVYDPGGYLRTPKTAETHITQEYARHQMVHEPNWRRDYTANRRHMIADRNQWPWRLPQHQHPQNTWWNPSTWGAANNQPIIVQPAPVAYNFNQYPQNQYSYPYSGNPYAAISPYAGYPNGAQDGAYWNNWNNYDGWNNWNNQYANVEPSHYGGGAWGILGLLGNLFGAPQGVGVGSGTPSDWLSNLLYSNGYSINGQDYPSNYFAMNGYVPTPYVFDVASGQYWQPGVGYSDSLPGDYQSPITVSTQEVVPSFDDNGGISGYQPQTFYNDAYWDNDARSYGYYDYRKKFHWAALPGLATSLQQYVQ